MIKFSKIGDKIYSKIKYFLRKKYIRENAMKLTSVLGNTVAEKGHFVLRFRHKIAFLKIY